MWLQWQARENIKPLYQKRGKILLRCTKIAGKVAADVKPKKTRVIHFKLDFGVIRNCLKHNSGRSILILSKITFFFLAVLALASISLRTKVLIVLTAIHAVVTMVSLFYFVAVRQLNKPTPEKPNAKINNCDENHVNWCLRMVKDLYRCSKKGALLAQAGSCRSLLIPLQCQSQKRTPSSCNEIIVTTGGKCRDKHCWCHLL